MADWPDDVGSHSSPAETCWCWETHAQGLHGFWAKQQRVADLEAENALLRERLADVERALARDQHFGSFASLYAGVWNALEGK